MEEQHNRRAVDPILNDIKKSVNRIDTTIHGNGKMGIKTRVFILWYAGIGLFALITSGCMWRFLGNG